MAEIELSGLNLEFRECARKELEGLFIDVENLEIIVTTDFDNKVTEYLQKRGINETYQSTRAGGEVVACKVLNYPSNGQLRTCLVINAEASMFSNWSEDWKIERIHALCHEMGHVFMYRERYRQIGHERFFSMPISTMDWMDEFADDILSEYIAERNAIQTLSKISKIDLTQYFTEKLEGLIEILANYLRSFKKFVTEKIGIYRTGRMHLDDFWGHVYLRTRDTLNALSLSVAYIHAIPSRSLLFQPIRSNETFKELFEKMWSEVEPVLVLRFEKQKSCEECVRQISDSFRNLFQLLGIELRDVNGRLALSLKS